MGFFQGIHYQWEVILIGIPTTAVSGALYSSQNPLGSIMLPIHLCLFLSWWTVKSNVCDVVKPTLHQIAGIMGR